MSNEITTERTSKSIGIMVSMVKSRIKKVISVLLLLLLIGIGTGGKRYMDKQKTEKEYQQGIELIQSYVTDYLVKNYQGIEKIEWQGIGVEYRNSPILGPSLFGNYVDTDVTIYASQNSYLTIIFTLNYNTEYNESSNKYSKNPYLSSNNIDELLEIELDNTIYKRDDMHKIIGLEVSQDQKKEFEKVKKSTTGSKKAKIVYNLKVHELIY
ncbi:hypothetical protein [Pseudolactococcus paracarnosus]|nr:conserved hypothetical protein [Lactococcus piscium]